ncbi:MAG: VanZ family protein [Chitinophagales bacterium]|nr:VanZ family protein [Bacteroidota bacterium]MCB9225994.1 VanZ family protein [Chitinophagales bacterium]
MEKYFNLHLKYAFIAIVLLVAIMYVSLLPKIELPKTNIFQADKIVHFSMYFILSVALFKGFFNVNLKKSLTFACVLSFLYGFIVEILQYSLTSTRMFDVFDIFANGMGAIFAYLIVSKYL